MKKKKTVLFTLIVLILIICIILYSIFRIKLGPSVENTTVITDNKATVIEKKPVNPDKKNDSCETDGTNDDKRSAFVVCLPEATIHKKSKLIDIFYQNPQESESLVTIELLINDKSIGKSGLINQNYELRTMDLMTDIETGVYSGTMLLEFYNVTDEQKDSFTTSVPITIKVLEE